jgi:hypothetical protein
MEDMCNIEIAYYSAESGFLEIMHNSFPDYIKWDGILELMNAAYLINSDDFKNLVYNVYRTIEGPKTGYKRFSPRNFTYVTAKTFVMWANNPDIRNIIDCEYRESIDEFCRDFIMAGSIITMQRFMENFKSSDMQEELEHGRDIINNVRKTYKKILKDNIKSKNYFGEEHLQIIRAIAGNSNDDISDDGDEGDSDDDNSDSDDSDDDNSDSDDSDDVNTIDNSDDDN